MPVAFELPIVLIEILLIQMNIALSFSQMANHQMAKQSSSRIDTDRPYPKPAPVKFHLVFFPAFISTLFSVRLFTVVLSKVGQRMTLALLRKVGQRVTLSLS